MSAEARRSTPVEASPRPRRLGRYRVLDELASGGMATVYLGAADGPAGFEKLVALKRVHPHLARDPRNREMFLDEARVAARIVHPNVCGVIDFGESNGEYYLAMDHLVGVPLARLMRVVSAKPALATSADWLPVLVRIVMDASEGLHAAHELKDEMGSALGVVHRDVSPSNLFVGFDGTTRVVDFGVAAFAGRLHHTVTGEVKGKLAYMSPEQVRQSRPDRRMDVWSLGVVAWELVSLRRLFRRDGTAATLYGVLEDVIAAPSAGRGDADGLDAPIMAALEREPDDRTPSARAFADGLLDALHRSGRRVATPAEVAAFVARAMPEEEQTKRERLVEARARFDDEQQEITASARAALNARERRWGMAAAGAGVAVMAIVALAVLRAATGVGTPEPPPVMAQTLTTAPSDVEPTAAVVEVAEAPPVDVAAEAPVLAEAQPSESDAPPPPSSARRRPPRAREGREPTPHVHGSVDLNPEW